MDDFELLARELADVRPLPANDKAELPADRSGEDAQTLRARREAAIADPKHDPNFLTTREPEPVEPRAILAFMRPGIQHGVYRNLRLGHYEPESVLDLHRKTVEHQFIATGPALGPRDAKAGGGVTLRVGVHDQNALADGGHGGGEVDGCCGFPDPTLLVRDGDDLAHA